MRDLTLCVWRSVAKYGTSTSLNQGTNPLPSTLERWEHSQLP